MPRARQSGAGACLRCGDVPVRRLPAGMPMCVLACQCCMLVRPPASLSHPCSTSLSSLPTPTTAKLLSFQPLACLPTRLIDRISLLCCHMHASQVRVSFCSQSQRLLCDEGNQGPFTADASQQNALQCLLARDVLRCSCSAVKPPGQRPRCCFTGVRRAGLRQSDQQRMHGRLGGAFGKVGERAGNACAIASPGPQRQYNCSQPAKPPLSMSPLAVHHVAANHRGAVLMVLLPRHGCGAAAGRAGSAGGALPRRRGATAAAHSLRTRQARLMAAKCTRPASPPLPLPSPTYVSKPCAQAQQRGSIPHSIPLHGVAHHPHVHRAASAAGAAVHRTLHVSLQARRRWGNGSMHGGMERRAGVNVALTRAGRRMSPCRTRALLGGCQPPRPRITVVRAPVLGGQSA